MKTIQITLATAASVLLIACGGDQPTPAPKECRPTGTWSVDDYRLSSTGGVCAGDALQSATSTIQIQLDGANNFTWIESGLTYSGTLSKEDCSASATAANTQTQDEGWNLVQTLTRTVKFDGDSLVGTSQFTLSADTSREGLPCSATFSVTGTRM